MKPSEIRQAGESAIHRPASVGTSKRENRESTAFSAALEWVLHLSPRAPEAEWRRAFDSLYLEAERAGSLVEFVETVRRRTYELCARGEVRHALAEVQFALGLSGSRPEITPALLVTLAIAQCESADIDAGISTLKRAERAAMSVGIPLPAELVPVTDQIDAMRLESSDRLLYEASHLLARGRIDEFQHLATAGLEIARSHANVTVVWRLQALRLYLAYVADNRAAGVDAIAGVESTLAGMNPLHQRGLAGLQCAAAELAGAPRRVPAALTTDTTFYSLGGILAGGEAAITQGVAATGSPFLDWTAHCHDRGIVTAVEWPALVDRVAALHAVQAGKYPLAVRRFLSAVEQAEVMGYRLEAALAQLQLAEIAAATGLRHAGLQTADLRQQAVAALDSMGIPAAPAAWRAARAWITSTQRTRARHGLTAAEREVLLLLQQGLTWEQAADTLGRSYATVRTHVEHVKDKLGVRTTEAALARAHEIGELD